MLFRSHQDFYNKIENPSNRPNINNTFYKGCDTNHEEYSCFNAKDKEGILLRDKCTKEVVISGIATEYCIKESVLALHQGGFDVTILKKGLAYVDFDGHNDTITLLRENVKCK